MRYIDANDSPQSVPSVLIIHTAQQANFLLPFKVYKLTFLIKMKLTRVLCAFIKRAPQQIRKRDFS